MPELSAAMLRAAVSPVALYVLLTSALLAWTQGVFRALSLLAFGLVAIGVVAALAVYRARVITRDLSALASQLQATALVDVGSLRPRTPEGRGIAAALAALIDKVRDAARSEDAVRTEIETAQGLRVNFVASMGHDLRGPLNNMLGFADLLLMDEQDEHAAEQRASIETIRQRTLDLLTLIDEILDWARLEAGRLVLRPEPTDLAELIDGVVELAEHRAAGRPVRLVVEHVTPGVMVEVDRPHVQQAIVAVMGDAIRSGQGVSVYLRAELQPRMDGAAPDAGERVVITVRDPSLLVRDEDQARFFEAFRPSYAPSGKRIAGLGLGVACARALFRAHGGDVSFVSRTGTGTEFQLSLRR